MLYHCDSYGKSVGKGSNDGGRSRNSRSLRLCPGSQTSHDRNYDNNSKDDHDQLNEKAVVVDEGRGLPVGKGEKPVTGLSGGLLLQRWDINLLKWVQPLPAQKQQK